MSTAAAEPLTYAYRPSMIGGSWQFTLDPHALRWESGEKSGAISYGDIRRIRLSFRPMNMQTYRFVTEIVAEETPLLRIVSTSWRSMVEHERRDQSYSDFVRELHRRVAASRAPVIFERGRSPLLYWPGFVVSLAIVIGLAVFIVRALQADAPLGAAMIAVFLALFVWQGVTFFYRNWPGRYAPDAVPRELLPSPG
jgi:hypothetical protein